MKHRLWAFVLLFPGSVWAAPRAKQAEYNLAVHVSASRTVKHSESAPRYQRRANQNTLEMTDKINGKIADTQQIELSSDLKTLTIIVHTVGRSEPNILVFERQ